MLSEGSAQKPTVEESAKFGLFLDKDFILPLFDMWMATKFDTISIFGCAYIELPMYVQADLRALLNRKAQLEAGKPKP